MKLHLVIQSFPRSCEVSTLGAGLTEELSLEAFKKGYLTKYLRDDDEPDYVKHVNEEMTSIYNELVSSGGFRHPDNEYFVSFDSIDID